MITITMLKNTGNFATPDIILIIVIFSVYFLGEFWPIMAQSPNPLISNLEPQQKSKTLLSQFNQSTVSSGINNSKVVIITFGDGYASQYTYAKPVLDKYGFKANFFVTCNKVGVNSRLTWQEIEQLYKEGNIIGSKTVDYGTKAIQNKDLNHLSARDLEFEVGQSKQCLLDHGISTTFFAVPKNLASNNATVVNTVARYYDLAINGHSNLMYLHCDGWKQDSSQTDCRTYFDNGTLTFANRYSIREWSMQHIGHGNSFNDAQMFEKFVAEINSQNKFNQKGSINAIPIIGYHDIVPIPDASDTTVTSATTINLFNEEMKYLHDNGFRAITFANLAYDEKTNSLYIE
ncbi:MAG: polysaccharide deacetylase family protein [Candidatus Nitrosocosmicus sp.]